MRLTDPCPVCERPLSSARLPEGYVYCERGHVVTLAPIDTIDLRNLQELAATLPVIPSEHGNAGRS